MKVLFYPDEPQVQTAMRDDDPLLVMVANDVSSVLVASIDESMEHSILLKQLGYRESDTDSFFRLVVNRSGADWTFVCPSNYNNITDKFKRIERFYNDGYKKIPFALKAIGYPVEINIPPRYQRHVKTV